MRSAVFLDRDAALHESRRDYGKSRHEFVFLPADLTSLRRLTRTHYAIVVISCQSPIDRGLLSRSEVHRLNQRMVGEIEQAGGRIDGIYVCPPGPDEGGGCGNLGPGLLRQAADELDIDLASSYLIADTISDVRASLAAGCKPILLLTDRACHDLEKGGDFGPAGFFLTLDFRRAVDLILKHSCAHRGEQGNSLGAHEPPTEARSSRDSEWAQASAMTTGEGRVRSAVFLDRDGVINENRRDYVKSWDEFEFLPGVLASLRRLASAPYAIVVLSNQSAINRGLVSWADVNAINGRMLREIKQAGGRVDGVYVCPHRPDEACPCRKPKPGLLHQAAHELDIDLASSYLVGDALCDMQAALTTRCVPLLVLTGRGQEELVRAQETKVVDFVYFPDLLQAVDLILSLPSDRATRQPPAPQRSRLP